MQSLGGDNARALYGAQQFRRPSRRSFLPANPLAAGAELGDGKGGGVSARGRRKTGVGTMIATSKVWSDDDDDDVSDTGTASAVATPIKKPGEANLALSPADKKDENWSPASSAPSSSPLTVAPLGAQGPSPVPSLAVPVSETALAVPTKHEGKEIGASNCDGDSEDDSENDNDEGEEGEGDYNFDDPSWPFAMGFFPSLPRGEDGNDEEQQTGAISAAGWAPAYSFLSSEDDAGSSLSASSTAREKGHALLPPLLPSSVSIYQPPNFSSPEGPFFPSSATITLGVPLGQGRGGGGGGGGGGGSSGGGGGSGEGNMAATATAAPRALEKQAKQQHSHLPLPLRPLPTVPSWEPNLTTNGKGGDSPFSLTAAGKGANLGGFSFSATASSAFCLGFGAALKRLRATVSKKKRRFQEEGFDLDLTYITPRVIAMGFPSSGGEGLYRNPLPQVQRFFESRHRGHYRIYNLCSERAYDPEDFCGRVARYAFDDHNPCPFELIPAFCADVHAWLGAHPANVVAIHCKAGKGRTGLMIAAYLLHAGVRRTAEACLRYFGVKRTKDMQGVTIPSQMRFVHYYERLLSCGAPPVYSYRLKWVRLRTVPNVEQSASSSSSLKGGCAPFFTLSDMNVHSTLLVPPAATGTGGDDERGEKGAALDSHEGWCGTAGRVLFDWRVAQAALSDLLGRHGGDITSTPLPGSATSAAAASGGESGSSSVASDHASRHPTHQHGPVTSSRAAFSVTNSALAQPFSLRKYKAHEPFVDFDCSLFDIVVKGNVKITLHHEKAGLLARAKGAVKGAKAAKGGGRRSRSGSLFQAAAAFASPGDNSGAAHGDAEAASPSSFEEDTGPSATVTTATTRPSSNLCHVWFHTAFIAKDYLYFPKHVIDKACKDKKGIFSPFFGMELYFERLPLAV